MRLLLTRILSALVLLIVAALFLLTRTGAVAATPAESPAHAKPAQSAPDAPPQSPSALCSSFSGYLVYTNTGVSLIPGTLDIGNHTDDGTTLITLPFAYTLYDQTFNSVAASSNGNLQFSSAGTDFTNACLPYSPFNFAIYPYWDDLITSCTGCGIYTSISGSAPNRIFNIEWRAQTFTGAFTTNFEVRLYEGRTQFELIYGTVGGSGSSATIGVQRDTGSLFTQYECNSGGLSSGMQQIYFLPSCTACSTGDYRITSSAGATVVPGTTRIDGAGCDDCVSPVTLPFVQTLYDQSYTTINVSSNGNAQFASSATAFTNACLPYSSFNYAILPYWDDLITTAAGDGIYTSTSGSAPNRIFNIEWRAHTFTGNFPVNFELRLYEGTTYFEVVYGPMGDNGSSATVGVQRDTGSRFTQYECNTAASVTGGLRLSFSLVCPPPPTATPTATNTPTSTFTRTPTSTSTPCVVQTPLSEGFESGNLNTFSSSVPTCVQGGCGWSVVTGTVHTGTYSAFSPDVANVADQILASNSTFAIPANGLSSATLSFWHRFTFEGGGANYYDGGVLETSTNSGVSWQDAGANITSGGYNGPIVGSFNNPLAGRSAWGQVSAGYPAFTQVVVNLLPYAGQNVRIRFRQGDDNSNASNGWWIDDVVVTLNYSACATNTPTSTPTPAPCAPVWSVAGSPNQGTGANFLYGVAAVSANDIWAVGYYSNGGINQTLVEHWNGSAWQVIASPNVGTSDNYLQGVAAVSANDVWAVGYYSNGGINQTLVEHWNGTLWSVVSSPNVGASNNYLNGVAAISANDVWAVGYYFNNGINQTLAEHWNGTSWSVVASPNVGTSSNVFNGVAAVSATDVWAVGIYYNGGISQTLIEHWNGSAWSVMSSPNVGTGNNILNGVAAVSANDVWAVGYYPNGSVNQTLVEHYASLCGTPTSTPTRTFTPTNTPTITPTGTNTPTNGPTNTPTRTFTPGNTPTNTPTGAATNTPTPTGTVVIVGHVTWQGRPAQPNALQQLPVTFSIGITSTVLNYPNMTTDSTGHFTVTVGLYPGSYTSRAIGPKYLANRTVFTVTTATSLSVELGLMKTGDANSDNVITVGDFNILKSTFGKAAGDPGYDGRADFTGDNSVNISDFNLLRGNFGLIGSPPCSNGVCPP